MHSDVIRAPLNNPDGDDDKVYFFFTEVSVEYEFFNKLLIPRIARVCKVGQQSFCFLSYFPYRGGFNSFVFFSSFAEPSNLF